MAPIASCEARYGGVVDTLVRSPPVADIHIADFSYLYLPAPVGNAGTGAVRQVQTIRGLYRFRIGPFFVGNW